MPPHDLLLFTGPQRPAYAPFYVHPRVNRTRIVTHTDWSSTMIERHVEEAVETYRQSLGGGEDLFPVPDSISTTAEESEDEDDLPDEPPVEPLSTSGLDPQAEQRVLDIVEFSPTKNAELVDAWGYENGSELYQYLSSELNEYFTRNDDKLIVPTEKARDFADDRDAGT